MTDQPSGGEVGAQAIEDLDAPADALVGVAGGYRCANPTCTNDTSIGGFCEGKTCKATTASCDLATHAVVVKEL